MATLIDKYTPTLEQMQDLHFVTLTIRNCSADNLPDTLRLMQTTWRKILDNARKRGQPCKGIRKLELKASTKYGYHPHFHILVEGEQAARYLHDEWLRRLPRYTVADAQDMRKVEDVHSAAVEIMKYATKLTCADDTKNEPLCTASQMDVIFRTLEGKRLIQPFGGLNGISEDEFEITPEVVRKAAGIYKWFGHDWYHIDFGQPLTNYVPEADEIQLYVRSWRSEKGKTRGQC